MTQKSETNERQRARATADHDRHAEHAVGAVELACRRRAEAHAGLPNRPSGRTASTTTSSANVSRIE